MIDHLFSAVLTFALLAFGTIAVGSELFETPTRATTTARQASTVAQLPTVVVVGKRASGAAVAGAQSTARF